MNGRIAEEVALLRTRYPAIDFIETGAWVRIPAYAMPAGWMVGQSSLISTDLVFQFPANGFPQNPFYGFYLPSGIRYGTGTPNHFTDPAAAQPPYPGAWAFFSGNPAPWTPAVQVEAGSNILSWVHGIGQRLREGLGEAET